MLQRRHDEIPTGEATFFGIARLPFMTQLTLQLAATHDHWLEEPATRHAIPALKLWWRHFARQYPNAVNALEWVACGLLTLVLLTAELIANA